MAKRSNGVWHDTAEAERLGSPGSGLGVTFSPTRAADPITVALRQYTCTPQHRTVKVAHMFLSHTRASVVQALGELRDKGCDVRVILSTRGAAKVLGAGALRNVGAQVSCTPAVHEKVVLVDAVRIADGRPDKLTLMGSQSLSGRALRNNDEALMRLSTHDAAGAAASANAAVWNAYSKQWSAILAKRTICD
jgi:phosphatidylserine/phosphatidylglycerophosphate/cardiolipin synthase-like enzyme